MVVHFRQSDIYSQWAVSGISRKRYGFDGDAPVAGKSAAAGAVRFPDRAVEPSPDAGNIGKNPGQPDRDNPSHGAIPARPRPVQVG